MAVRYIVGEGGDDKGNCQTMSGGDEGEDLMLPRHSGLGCDEVNMGSGITKFSQTLGRMEFVGLLGL